MGTDESYKSGLTNITRTETTTRLIFIELNLRVGKSPWWFDRKRDAEIARRDETTSVDRLMTVSGLCGTFVLRKRKCLEVLFDEIMFILP